MNETARGRAIASVLFFAMGATIGAAQYCFGLFVPPLEAEFGWSRTEISASLSFVAVGSLVGPLLGRIMDRFGARPVLVGSLLLSAVSYLARPLMTELWHWYALSFVQFIAFSGATVLPTGRLIAIWFGDRRGRVMGITSAGPNFGGFVLPIAVVALLTVVGWQGSYVALGLVLVAIALAAQLLIREAPAHLSGAGTSGGGALSDSVTGWTVKQAVATPAFYLITLATVSAFFTYSTVLPHVIVHMINEGVSPAKASFILGVLAMFGMAGKLAFGYLSERITARKAFIVDLVGQGVFVFLLAWSSPAWFVLWAPLYGFFLGGTGVLAPLIIQEFFGLRHFGAVSGLSSMATVVSFGIGPLLAGWSFDVTGSYANSFVGVAVVFMAGAGFLMITRPAEPQS